MASRNRQRFKSWVVISSMVESVRGRLMETRADDDIRGDEWEMNKMTESE